MSLLCSEHVKGVDMHLLIISLYVPLHSQLDMTWILYKDLELFSAKRP